MTKIKAPLFSLDAAGTLDKNITYKKKLQNNIAQKYATPGSKNPFESSPRQKDQRSIIRLITIHWQCMTAIDKLAWENAAKDARFKGTGYHYFLHLAQTNLTQYLGLVGYWSMNYNIGDKIPDLSGNGNHGTLGPIYPCDSPTLVNSFDKKHGKAASFDGINDYISVDPFIHLPIFTISLLVKIPIITGKYMVLFCKQTAFNNRNYYLYVRDSDDFLYFSLSIASAYNVWNTGTNINLNKWFNIVIKYDNSHVYFYLNGATLYPTQVLSGVPDDPNIPLLIGTATSAGLNATLGLIDEVLIFNYGLDYSEINKIYQSYNLP